MCSHVGIDWRKLSVLASSGPSSLPVKNAGYPRFRFRNRSKDDQNHERAIANEMASAMGNIKLEAKANKKIDGSNVHTFTNPSLSWFTFDFFNIR